MSKIKLLDCTLRDGGFINEWRFGKEVILNIIERLNLAGIDFIELGYLRDFVKYDINNSQFSSTDDAQNILSKIQIDKKITLILDYGACDINNIHPALKTKIYGIRLTFKKSEIQKAFEFAIQLQNLGYKVFLQPVNIMGFSTQELLRVIQNANKINPETLCIVDTYGFMDRHDLLEKFYLLDGNLHKNIKIGYHSHNNLQLAYSNCVELIEHNTQREIILDCSVFGMGKGAGNAHTELLASYLNKKYNFKYNIEQILEIIDIYIEKERQRHFWGYSLLYYLAAITKTHHSYVRFLLNKKTLSIKSIKDILLSLDEDKKASFDEEYIKTKYKEFQSISFDDSKDLQELKQNFKDQNILLLGLGNSVYTQKHKINKFINQKQGLVVAINHIPQGVKADFIFISNAKRYGQISDYRHKTFKVILTSNITPSFLKPDFILNYEKLLINKDPLTDFGGLMMLNALVKLRLKRVFVAGFDGFNRKNNYIDDMYNFTSENNIKNEEKFSEYLKKISKDIDIRTITYTNYDIKGI